MRQGYITVKRASEIMGVTPHYVRKLIKDNKIKGHQGRNSNRWEVERASIEEFRKTEQFKRELSELSKPQPMSIKEAVENVEELFDGDVITYIMTPNQGSMIEAGDALHLDNMLSKMAPRSKGREHKKFNKIILVLNSGGGILEAALKIVGVIKTYANEFEVIVPFMAKSAATIISLKADKLFLTTVSELGPVDPVVQSPTNPMIKVPAQSIEQYINAYGNQLKNTDRTPLDEIIIQKLSMTIDPYLLGAYKSAQEFARSEFLESLKKFHLSEEQILRLEEMFLHKKSHAYPILYSDLEDYKIAELIKDTPKLASVKTLMTIFDTFMGMHNIVKTIGYRDEMSNTAMQQPAAQRTVQTGTEK